MRLCPLPELEHNMVLGKSIYLPNGKLLLGAGYHITSDLKMRLQERGYTHVYIMEEGTEDVVPEDIISEEVAFQAKSKLADKVSQIKNQAKFREVSCEKAKQLIEDGYLNKVNITYDMASIVKEILKDISSAGSQLMNSTLFKTADSYFFDHALNVTVLSIFIGRRLRFSHKELMSLGLGCFLHDIGKIVIDQLKDSDKPAKANELYKEHPTFGYLMLRNSPEITPLETQVVNQHHEQQDGKGFPIGLKGDNLPPIKTVVRKTKGNIFRFAEICCVADAFDKMVFNPNEKVQKSPDQAIKRIIVNGGKAFNREVVQTLLSVVPFFPVGTNVKIMDIVDPNLIGYRGVVAKINEKDINKPVIILTRNKFLKKIKPMLIDTSKFTNVDLKLVL